MFKKIMTYIGYSLAVAAFITMMYGIDHRYAYHSSLVAIAATVQDVKDSIRFDKVQERVWKLEEWYDKKAMPAPVKEQYKELKQELKDIKDKQTKPATP